MDDEQRKQLEVAIHLLRMHCQVDYNNYLQIDLAQNWINDTLNSIQGGYSLPLRPIYLMNQPN